MAASTMTKFFRPVRFTYSTCVTTMPALPEMNRPGSTKIFSPSGCNSGSSRSGVFLRRQNVFRRRRFPPAGRTTLQRGLINDAQSAADAEKFDPMPRFQFPHQRQHLPHGIFKRRRRP